MSGKYGLVGAGRGGVGRVAAGGAALLDDAGTASAGPSGPSGGAGLETAAAEERSASDPAAGTGSTTKAPGEDTACCGWLAVGFLASSSATTRKITAQVVTNANDATIHASQVVRER